MHKNFIRLIGVGILFVVLIFTKAIFEYSFYLLTIPFACLMLRRRDIRTGVVVMIIIVTASCSFYKYLNGKYNGVRVFTDRGGWLLYGATAQRTGDIKLKDYLVSSAYILGDGFCRKLFKDKCSYWRFSKSDELGIIKLKEVCEKVERGKVKQVLMKKSLLLMRKKPLQYIILTLQQAVKMTVWESTRIGFVQYPPFIQRLYDNTLFKNLIRLVMFILTGISLMGALLFRDRKYLFIIYFIVIYIGLNSLVNVITRYALPIAPLYLIIIGYMFSHLRDGLRLKPKNPKKA